MKLATVFSGIGAIEQALHRMGIDYEIVFACDNGDVELNLLEGEDFADYKRLTKMRSKKEKMTPKDENRLKKEHTAWVTIITTTPSHFWEISGSLSEKLHVEQLYKKKGKGHNFVKETYLANYSDHIDVSDFHLDVRFFDGRDYSLNQEIDLLVGGSPCQAFSAVGAKYGLNDTRGTLFYEFARIVNETQPRVFIFENVRGLLTHDNGHTWDVMKAGRFLRLNHMRIIRTRQSI